MTNYKSYLESLLSYNMLAMKGHLVSQRFLIDDPKCFNTDSKTPTMGENQEQRRKWFNKSQSVDWEIPLASDILRVRTYYTVHYFP